MKQSLACVWVLATSVACGAGGVGATNARGGAGASGSGSAGAGGKGASNGGANGNAGTSTGIGGGTAGGSSGTSGAAPSGGASGAGASGAGQPRFTCPDGVGTLTLPTAPAEHIPGTTPLDAFNTLAGFSVVEGPVWIGDSLYVSELLGGNNAPPPAARILKIAPGNVVTVAVADSGSNGMAVDSQGNLFAAVHKDGSISQVTLPSGPLTPIIPSYMGSRFLSPNDLAIRSDGTIYFSDPNYQNATMPAPQAAERLYRVTPPPARTVTAIADAPARPNGVSLSPDEMTLYVTSAGGFKKFAVMPDGSLGPAADFASNYTGDGMAVDCAGNVYVAGGSPSVTVYSSAGASLGTIQLSSGGGTTTNAAFGGADHKTLYITAFGNDGQRGVFSIAMNVPGLPY